MFLKYRPVRQCDLPQCLECVHDSYAGDPDGRNLLLDFWRQALAERMANAAVIEDLRAPAGEGIVWFCLKVFITDAFAHDLKSGAAPFVDRQVLDRWAQGESPCLTWPEIRLANSTSGVTILVMNSGAPPHMRKPDTMRILADRVIDFLPYCICGYRCKEILQECHDPFTCNWAAGAGFRVRADYERFYETIPLPQPLSPPGKGEQEVPTPTPSLKGRESTPHPSPLLEKEREPEKLLPPEQRLRLYGVTVDEAAASAGTLASKIFSYQPPRFFFKPCEQELLVEALLGETDEELAVSLDVALATIRKRWLNIYDRVAAVDDSLLPTGESSLRTTEKKRRLLNYLRQHMEEMRPLEASRGLSLTPSPSPVIARSSLGRVSGIRQPNEKSNRLRQMPR